MKLFFVFWVALFGLTYSNHLHSQSNHQPYLIQQGKRFELNDTMNRIQLKRERFELHVFTLPYHESTNELNCVQVAILLDSNAMTWTRENMPCDSILYFGLGTGYAGYENKEYDYFLQGNEGHYFLYFENEKNNRAKKIAEERDGLLELSWTIDGVLNYDTQETTPLKQHPEIFNLPMVIFSDRNNNNRVDENEYRKVLITWNP